ncbi:MAG: tetratricopeptide repeat protein [Candidatus Latescibacteria bacterium]|nr:tetratricopeptide repeat protein [Candidatus Latescibacterota bacterium]
MRIAPYLRAHKLLFAILLLALGAAGVERYLNSHYRYLQPRSNPRGAPQLQGEALQDLAAVLQTLYPEGAEANLAAGQARLEQGKLQEARLLLEKALEADRRNQQLLFLYARLLLDQGEAPEKVKAVVDELGRYFPRSREKVEEFFSQASKGKIRFEGGGLY